MLGAAIASAQKAGRDVEVIVVDDASTDNTSSICADFGTVKYMRMERNVGQACARNAGIAMSSGEYVVFLDDDDLRLPGSVDKQVECLSRRESVSFAYGQVLVADSQTRAATGELRPKKCLVGDIFWPLLHGNFIHIPSVLARKRHVEEVGMFDPDPGLRGTEDWDLWIRLAENYMVDAVHEPVAIYRDFSSTSGQTSSNRPGMCLASSLTLAKALRSPRALTREQEALKKMWSNYTDGLWENLLGEGRAALSSRRYRYAMANFLTAIQLNPRRARRPAAIRHFVADAIASVCRRSH